MTGSDLDRELLVLWRKAGAADRARIQRLLAGMLSGRVTLAAGEARYLSRAEVVALADCLPDESPTACLRPKPH